MLLYSPLLRVHCRLNDAFPLGIADYPKKLAKLDFFGTKVSASPDKFLSLIVKSVHITPEAGQRYGQHRGQLSSDLSIIIIAFDTSIPSLLQTWYLSYNGNCHDLVDTFATLELSSASALDGNQKKRHAKKVLEKYLLFTAHFTAHFPCVLHIIVYFPPMGKYWQHKTFSVQRQIHVTGNNLRDKAFEMQ
jgi:hypothetical protein